MHHDLLHGAEVLALDEQGPRHDALGVADRADRCDVEDLDDLDAVHSVPSTGVLVLSEDARCTKVSAGRAFIAARLPMKSS